MGVPFRADQVGSLLRPPELKKARQDFKNGKITAQNLKAVEDREIRRAVAMQEAAGLQAVTDGEFRRAFWHVDFLTGFEGIAATQGQYALKFHGEGGAQSETRSMMVVTGKVKRTKPVMVEHFEFLKKSTSKIAKLCIPAPTYMHMRGGRKVVDQAAYPDIDEFWADITRAYQEEIADLAAAGCTYLQIDDVSFATLCDEGIRAQVRRDGEDPDKLPFLYSKIITSLLAKKPESMGVTMHTCRGNHASMWMAEGGYDAVAEGIFQTGVDGFFLEYDTSRAGGFEPLRFVPKGKKVVLGLISTKTPVLEKKDVLKKRVDEAAKYVPLENLCLSPQCGFASSETGNRLSEDDEKRKLELVVQVASEVWG
ncbi:MAG: 5-methyltetrahydropteroyltriglutamate--homocysteine methyltransferase [Betaproteobacteria bacterium]|jgi:5-methyltetrahydropteroyltriglutamate--homocysteine methyltransferase|nr:5-methyltetrahydropteroyltriglutamate--homocysteine methyltransferase [Betaproteobacteria bacterium]